jgi:hypothetical protein
VISAGAGVANTFVLKTLTAMVWSWCWHPLYMLVAPLWRRLAGVDGEQLVRNFVAVAVFFLPGIGVYLMWAISMAGWPELRWLSLKNQEPPHSQF